MNQASIQTNRAMAERKRQLPKPLSTIQRYGLALLSVAVALGGALRAWLDDAGLRRRLRAAARERRESLPGWSNATSMVAGTLAGASR